MIPSLLQHPLTLAPQVLTTHPGLIGLAPFDVLPLCWEYLSSGSFNPLALLQPSESMQIKTAPSPVGQPLAH